MEPPGCEQHRRAACEGERAGANESNALQRPHHASAFTLIELLVVIFIIAILIGFFLPTLFGMYERAKKVQAKHDLTQIVNAVNAFYTEYGKYPLPAGTTTDTTYGPGGTAANEVLLKELRACQTGQPSCPNPASVNTRQIVYISPRVLGTAPVRSAIASDNGQFYDPWQTPYSVTIDGNYDNSVANPYGAQNVGGAGSNPVPLGVIGWSRGKDQMLGTNGDNVYKDPTTGAQSDDVISWQ
jgi:prepilin-type N-terminal cleavage/methylation domain-containing protein